jgi:hypothetical protein
MEIVLTQEQVALIDDEDYELVSKFKWYARKHGNTYYSTTNINKPMGRASLQMHRLIMNAPIGKQVDHINGNGLDNRRKNLRFSTQQQNCMNRIKRDSSASSRYKGVSFHKPSGKWRSRIQIDGKLKYLGYFTEEEEAAKAYDNAALKYFGEFARVNYAW